MNKPKPKTPIKSKPKTPIKPKPKPKPKSPIKPKFNKIFSLGLTKTGTTSLHQALLALGIKSTHDLEDAYRIDRAAKQKKKLLALCSPKIQAITGGTIWHQYLPILDKQYPGSKFILPVRDIDDWLVSIKRHTINHNQIKKANRPFDPQKLRQQYHQHVNQVKTYFKDRPQDLLILNITGGEGYQKLCPFLGLPPKNQPFPHKNSLKNKIKVYQL